MSDELRRELQACPVEPPSVYWVVRMLDAGRFVGVMLWAGNHASYMHTAEIAERFAAYCRERWAWDKGVSFECVTINRSS